MHALFVMSKIFVRFGMHSRSLWIGSSALTSLIGSNFEYR